MTLPDPADALPGADSRVRRAVALLTTSGAATDAVAAELVGLLEAAGGPDVGNAARAAVERAARERAAPPRAALGGAGPLTADAARHRVLTAAARLHRDATDAITQALGGAPPARVEFAVRVLTERRVGVRTVLVLLAGRELPDEGDWQAALVDPAP